MSITSIPHDLRQIDQRQIDGLVVTLTWDATDDEVLLTVEDERFPLSSFTTLVPKGEAPIAFRHPFLYEPLFDAVDQPL